MAAVGTFFTDLWESVFTPGPTPTLLVAANWSFGSLQFVLLSLLLGTRSIHFLLLSCICAGLWWGINWFARELQMAQAREKMAKEREMLSGSETETEILRRERIETDVPPTTSMITEPTGHQETMVDPLTVASSSFRDPLASSTLTARVPARRRSTRLKNNDDSQNTDGIVRPETPALYVPTPTDSESGVGMETTAPMSGESVGLSSVEAGTPPTMIDMEGSEIGHSTMLGSSMLGQSMLGESVLGDSIFRSVPDLQASNSASENRGLSYLSSINRDQALGAADAVDRDSGINLDGSRGPDAAGAPAVRQQLNSTPSSGTITTATTFATAGGGNYLGGSQPAELGAGSSSDLGTGRAFPLVPVGLNEGRGGTEVRHDGIERGAEYDRNMGENESTSKVGEYNFGLADQGGTDSEWEKVEGGNTA